MVLVRGHGRKLSITEHNLYGLANGGYFLDGEGFALEYGKGIGIGEGCEGWAVVEEVGKEADCF